MSRVRSKNTTPELKIRSLIHRLGFRFRLHYKKLPGKPDLAFPGKKKVIFVNGCFWHGHENCSKGNLPKSNLELWDSKIARNKERDAENAILIKNAEWKILIVWQCELKNFDVLTAKILSFLSE